ncbi:MAG: NUDIX domain-containing protein [Marinilabiliales bacterium]
MYKIFYKENMISFSEKPVKDAQNYKYIDKYNLEIISKELLSGQKVIINVYHHNLDKTFMEFSSLFYNMFAAGALVKNNFNELLFIYKYGKWDLPKGKIDKGELPLEAAKREVQEETGVVVDKTGNEILRTYHIFNDGEKYILKTVIWFEMYCEKRYKPTPQTIEQILKAEWIQQKNLKIILSNTYQNIIDVLDAKNLIT